MPTYPIPDSLRQSVFNTITGYGHMLSRTRANDSRTRLTHSLQLIHCVEAQLLKACPALFTLRRRFGMPRLLWGLTGRRGRYSADAMLEETCHLLVVYHYRCQLADAKAGLQGRETAGELKKEYARETAAALINMVSDRTNTDYF